MVLSALRIDSYITERKTLYLQIVVVISKIKMQYPPLPCHQVDALACVYLNMFLHANPGKDADFFFFFYPKKHMLKLGYNIFYQTTIMLSFEVVLYFGCYGKIVDKLNNKQ